MFYSPRVNTSATMGALVRGEFRRKLDRVQFHGLLDSWSEQKGLISSEFFIKGIDLGVWESILEWINETNGD